MQTGPHAACFDGRPAVDGPRVFRHACPLSHGCHPTSVQPPGVTAPVILFDGVCNLCNGWVRWVVARDPRGVFRFASLQSQAARDVLRHAGSDAAAPRPDSIVLVDEQGLHVESDAVLRVLSRLGPPYSLLVAARLVPRIVRDVVYRTVARNRYHWFGRRETCMLPSPGMASRFLDADNAPVSDHGADTGRSR